MDREVLIKKIKKLKEKRKAIILAHLYQNDTIQELADFTGDSLELSKKAAETDAETLVFCGVRFMAETAKILSPDKTVLLPSLNAGCPLADMISAEKILPLKQQFPEAAVVCYVNSSAEVKAGSDYCCTSSNAVSLVRNIPEKEIIFIPDNNLGNYVAAQVPEKRILLWDGYCPIHDRISGDDLKRLRTAYPQAPILVHPECRPEICKHSDFVGSTAAILKYARESAETTLIIGTEQGILYRLQKENPHKKFVMLASELECADMKITTLSDIYHVLLNLENEINVDEQVRVKALSALALMLKYS